MSQLLQNAWLVAGWAAAFAVVAAFLRSLALSLRRQRLLAGQFEAENALFEQQIELLREKRAYELDSSKAWDGFANFVVFKKVHHRESDICSFYLRPSDPHLSLVDFLPGQHLTFELPIVRDGKKITRRYSLSDCPGKEYYRISVKRARAPRPEPGEKQTIPDGVGSTYFHDEIEPVSDASFAGRIQVACPEGTFHLDPHESRPVVLIGGGVGITPMLSMFNAILEKNESREVWLFYCVRDAGENILFDEGMLPPRWKELVERDNIHLHVYYSGLGENELPADVPSGVGQHSGRLLVAAEDEEAADEGESNGPRDHADHAGAEGANRFHLRIKDHLESNNYHFYVCGPDAMMDSVEEQLQLWGVPGDCVFSERFGPSRKGPDAAPQEVSFAKSEAHETYEAPADKFLLGTAEKAGVTIPWSCRVGVCGMCKVGLVRGEVAYEKDPVYPCPPGSCLTCCSYPKTEVVLDC